MPTTPASPTRLAWLRTELDTWQHEGLIDAPLARTLAQRYQETRRLTLTRLLLTLGAAFVGVGLIWLVAAHLDALPPLGRFLALVALWTGLLLAGARARGLLAGALRLLGALAFGAVVFQAAQSLQMPAFGPHLLGVWAAGALVQAYAFRAVGPLLVGVGAGAGWFVWQVLDSSFTPLAGVLALATLGVAGVSVAGLHGRGPLAEVWREAGAAALLAGLFVAALPLGDGLETDAQLGGWLIGGIVVALVLAGVAIASGDEPDVAIAALVTTLAAVGLVLWETTTDPASVGLEAWAHAGVGIVGYVVAAVGVALLGVRHDSWRLSAVATSALVLFTTVQSFAVFAQIIQGAWLFVALGLVFLGTGVAFDRARRTLTASLEATTTGDPR